MIVWYLLICGFDRYKSDCTWSPPIVSHRECLLAERAIDDWDGRRTMCIALTKVKL